MKANKEQNLNKHLYCVMLMAMHCAEYLGVNDTALKEVIGLSAFLHDVGKATKYFQNISLREEKTSTKKFFDLIREQYPQFSGEDGKDWYPRHNEISWLWAALHATGKSLFKKVGLQAIYWHHGTFDINPIRDTDTKSLVEELTKFSPDEWKTIDQTIKSLIDNTNFPFDITKYLDDNIEHCKMSPLFDIEDKAANNGMIENAQRWVIRSCVMYADATVSRMSSDELNDLILNRNPATYFKPYYLSVKPEFVCPEGYDPERFRIQSEIYKSCNHTTVVKAPAGFGKTLIGLMWGLLHGQQFYWVCPRNDVAQGVFENIKEELRRLNININVELFLTSERQDSFGPNVPHVHGTCDIVVTNIDMLMAPLQSHKHACRVFDINARNIIMDEFHELIGDEGMFSAFINYMRARNLICSNTRTLLLSATPSVLNELWDSDTKQTRLLPDDEHHYKAQHDKPYYFKFATAMPTKPLPGSLSMYCSISTVIVNYNPRVHTAIIHSHYPTNYKKDILNGIFKTFGKGGDKNGTVISAPILQAAFDISFRSMYKAVESPEGDIQPLGRVNRWGELESAEVVLVPLAASNPSERGAINTRYDLDLHRDWLKYLKNNIKSKATLDEVYSLYNAYNNVAKPKLISYYYRCLDKATERLSKFFPKDFGVSRPSRDNIKSVSNLRSYSPSFFIVVRNLKTKDWHPFAFNIQNYDLDECISENREKLEAYTIKTVMEHLNELKFEDGECHFDYSKILNRFFNPKRKSEKKIGGKLVKITSKVRKNYKAEDFIDYIRETKTPLPVFDRFFDPVRGLVKEEFLYAINY